MTTQPSRFRPPGAKTITALASLAASLATVLALFVVPGDNGPGSAQASPPNVSRACRVTQKGWDDQARREPAFRAAVRHGRTLVAQRDAIIDETQARIASSGAAMSTLRATGSPPGEAAARYARTLRAWSRNLARLERYRDALSGASTFAAVNRAATANNHRRRAFDKDARTVMAGLQALGGEACELDPPPPTRVTHLNEPGAKPHPKPDVVPDAARRPPVVDPKVATPDVTPGDASPDVAPSRGKPDVSPDVAPSPAPVEPDVAPQAAPVPDVGSGAGTTTDGASAP
ncbi:MAG: hypothetical protein ACXVFN_23115 [Solirubrobacteraceae bacterium]